MELTMKKTYMLLAALAAVLLADAAAPAFEKVPDAARVALKGARGKPVRKGFVFVNGHYLPPPYVVARYGTAIFVNNVQVTGQVVPWKSFLATQPGNEPAVTPAPAAPAKKATAIDDLFDDGGTSAQQEAAAKPAFTKPRLVVIAPLHPPPRQRQSRTGRRVRLVYYRRRSLHNSRRICRREIPPLSRYALRGGCDRI